MSKYVLMHEMFYYSEDHLNSCFLFFAAETRS